CLPRSPDDKPDLYSIVSPIKNADIVFIKHYAPLSSQHIKAIGVVLSDYLTENDLGICLPVDWAWRGEKILENFKSNQGQALSFALRRDVSLGGAKRKTLPIVFRNANSMSKNANTSTRSVRYRISCGVRSASAWRTDGSIPG
ncbi:MAG: hypothetical protein WAT12_01170, partial [Candidatus Nitrotoga sp.]